MHPCIVCSRKVTNRHHAMQCESCERWQHRTCNTGVSLEVYRKLVRGEQDLQWYCGDCERNNQVSHDESTAGDENTESNAGDDADGSASDYEPDSADPCGPPDTSFELTESFTVPDPITERSITDDETVEDSDDTDDEIEIEYMVIENGTQKGKRKLCDNQGYTYVLKRRRTSKYGEKIDWQCSSRRKGSDRCPATVVENNRQFTTGPSNHSHPAKPGIKTAVVITAKVKEKAARSVFVPSGEIVANTMRRYGNVDEPGACRPKPLNLQRVVNRHREKMRPKEPNDLDFEINTNYVPDDFLRGDITVKDARHIVFATEGQLLLLAKSKVWYMDGTFKIIRAPFKKLFAIHAFIKSGEKMKQVPLAFIFMSRRRKIDYKKVLEHIVSILPHQPRVQVVVADFEEAIWRGVRSVFPCVVIRGCVFHWTQAVWRKVQEIGLRMAYMAKRKTYNFIRKLMALPFLPAEHIQPAFHKLCDLANSDKTRQLVHYVRTQWVNSDVYPPTSWSVFNQSVRTNNDTEGWHKRINTRAKSVNLPFYILVPLLSQEADDLPMMTVLVNEAKLSQYQRKRSRTIQAELFNMWDLYQQGSLSVSQLLRECAKFIDQLWKTCDKIH